MTTWRTTALLVLGLVTSTLAYIPAQPVNDTSNLDADLSVLSLAWANGVYATPISKQLQADAYDDNGNLLNQSDIVPWTRFSKGVLLHFDESLRNQPPAAVPWIALISCDSNGTSFSQEDDIFTITRDQGAQAALLYSLTSQGCRMNADYLGPSFDKVLDVYATTSVSAARIIEQQFIDAGISSNAYQYNSALLNESVVPIEALLSSNALSISGNVPTNATNVTVTGYEPTPISTYTLTGTDFATDADAGATDASSMTASEDMATPTVDGNPSSTPSPSATMMRQKRQVQTTPTRTSFTSAASASTIQYLGAVMAARNNTVGGSTASTPSPSATGRGGGGPNTGLAMIILYAITGVVTFLFLIVILSGAIRAIRHPERYGPRSGHTGSDGSGPIGEGQGRQTRAHGLTRAILDTFPVVKFGGHRSHGTNDAEASRVAELRRRGTDDTEAGKYIDGRSGVEMDVLARTRTSMTEDDARRSVAVLNGDARCQRSTSESSRSAADADNLSFVSAREEAPPIDVGESDQPQATGEAPAAMTINPADVDDAVTCPICVCEFEDGDDVRILPCDGRHRFHQECIDPWLLQVSSLCPLCRLDLSGGIAGPQAARRRHQQERDAEDEDDAQREAHSEQQIISNLRAMLHGGHRARSGSNASGGQRDSLAGTGGPGNGVSRNRFFRYVATRRRQRQGPGDVSLPSGDNRSPPTAMPLPRTVPEEGNGGDSEHEHEATIRER